MPEDVTSRNWFSILSLRGILRRPLTFRRILLISLLLTIGIPVLPVMGILIVIVLNAFSRIVIPASYQWLIWILGFVAFIFSVFVINLSAEHFRPRVRNFLFGEAEQEKDISRRKRLPQTPEFVDTGRIKELEAIDNSRFDLRRLIELCEELNRCYANECYLAVSMLVRAILDHIPPIFGYSAFSEVANNYGGGGASFKKSMQHLQASSRNIADASLHLPIRQKEALPSRAQVNFSNDLDVLLAEIVRVLK